ncbi:MAG TPA: methylmalonyl-CoA mutase family protein [Mesorhizobium sp.]|jgi:methylmalonyl-CoA mutase|nr:methylmalonyl-CoA mutase family protein [Mesorhizobium sp.]
MSEERRESRPVFPEASREQWRAAAERALKGQPLDEALRSFTDDGIPIEPLAPRRPDAAVWRGKRARPALLGRMDDPDPARANAQAHRELAEGADGLALVFAGAPTAHGFGLAASLKALQQVLDGIPLGRIVLRVDAHPSSRQSAEWLLMLLGKARVDPARLELSFGIDPAAIFGGTGRLKMSIEALEASLPPSLAHYFALGAPGVLLEADGRVFHEAGATEAQELGAILSSALSYLRMFEEARQPLVYAAPHIGFALSVDQDQLLGLAKLRATRVLWARLAESCGLEVEPVAIHAETSRRMLTRKDPETNIVRNTVAAFTAIAGGADSLSLLPHTLPRGLPDPFARRLARNTALVLAQEAHLGSVQDPASGAGAIEALTDRLCETAWDEFRRIEGEGGILRSLEAGAFQARIREARERREKAVRDGERIIIGTTHHALKEERAVAVLNASPRGRSQAEGVAVCEPLLPVPLNAAVEEASQ